MTPTRHERLERIVTPYLDWARRFYAQYGANAYVQCIRHYATNVKETLLPDGRVQATYDFPDDESRRGRLFALMWTVVGEAIRRSPTFAEVERDSALLEFEDVVSRFAEQAGMPMVAAVRETHASMQAASHEVKFHRSGRRVYEVSPGLAKQLRHTELRGLTCGDLKLPYPVINVVVPPESGIILTHPFSGMHQLAGIDVVEDLLPDGSTRWNMLFVGAANDGDPDNDALYHFHLAMRPEQGIDEMLALEKAKAHGDARVIELAPTLFRFLMNVVLYATMPDAEREEMVDPAYQKVAAQVQKHPKGSAKRERAAEKLRNTPNRGRVYLGRAVQWSDEATDSGSSTPMLVRTLVAGHWKNQPYGPGRHERKRIWIQPYWRGPLDAPESNPVRVLVTP